MGKICRLCLKLTNSNEITNITKEHLLQLHFVVPEIDLKTKLVKSPLICMECTRSLQVAHNFKSMCLETEKRLESYLDGNGMVNFKELLDMDCDNKKDQEQDFLFSHLVHDKVEENNENQEELNSIIDDIPYSPPKLLLPTKSQNLYQRQYQHFITWCESQKIETYSENVFLMYFNEKARSQKASTLWSIYSMLKSTFIAKHNINMSVYTRLITFIKQQNLGYIPKQSNVFNRKQVCKFLEEAPDHKYLLWKVCLIFGIAGACRSCELKNMMTYHIEDKDDLLIITIPETKIGKSLKARIFTITEKMFNNSIRPINIYRQYLSLRPPHIQHNSFFIYYSEYKCSTQPIGIHTIGKIPAKIASYLNIGDANSYTGHAFRRTSTSLLADRELAVHADDEEDTSLLKIKQEVLN